MRMSEKNAASTDRVCAPIDRSRQPGGGVAPTAVSQPETIVRAQEIDAAERHGRRETRRRLRPGSRARDRRARSGTAPSSPGHAEALLEHPHLDRPHAVSVESEIDAADAPEAEEQQRGADDERRGDARPARTISPRRSTTALRGRRRRRRRHAHRRHARPVAPPWKRRNDGREHGDDRRGGGGEGDDPRVDRASHRRAARSPARPSGTSEAESRRARSRRAVPASDSASPSARS